MSKLIVTNIQGTTTPANRMTVKSGSALAPDGGFTLANQDFLPTPSGTEANRDAQAPIGAIRFNTTTNKLQAKTSTTAWQDISVAE